MSAEEWANARNDVHHNALDFAPFLRKVSSKLGLSGSVGSGEGALPELAPMAHYSNWITPRSVVRPAKRFDAHFFITVLDKTDVFGSDKSLQISADGSETLSLRLQTPREIMYAGITDQISLFPPQFYVSVSIAYNSTSFKVLVSDFASLFLFRHCADPRRPRSSFARRRLQWSHSHSAAHL